MGGWVQYGDTAGKDDIQTDQKLGDIDVKGTGAERERDTQNMQSA